jgi:hypothetical protein
MFFGWQPLDHDDDWGTAILGHLQDIDSQWFTWYSSNAPCSFYWMNYEKMARKSSSIKRGKGNGWTIDHQALTRTRLLKLQNHSLSNPFPTRPTGTVHIWKRNFLVSHLSACILNDLQSMHLSQTEKADGTMSLTQCRRHKPNDLHRDSWVISESCKMIDFIEHDRYSHNLNSIYIRVVESGKE